MFTGHYRHILDPKGRLSIPGKFRDDLMNGSTDNGSSGTLMVTAHFNECLVAYPIDYWTLILEKFRGLPMMDPDVMDFMRAYISRATECPLDSHGRILLPPDLRGLLNKDIVLLGMDYKFEIWDHKRWKEKMDQIIESQKQISASPALANLRL